MRIEAEVRSLQDLMRRDPGLDGDAQRLEQLVWLVLLRVCTSKETTLPVDQLPEDLRWNTWTRQLPVDAELIPSFVENVVLGRLRLQRRGNAAKLGELLGPIRNRMTNGQLLRELIGRVDSWSFKTAADYHQLGRLYEHLIAAIGGAGNAGEFYTPRPLTRLLAELVDLREGDIVLDPASGTSGMLVSALSAAEANGFQIDVRGIEKKGLPHLLGCTNLVLHGVPRLDAVNRDNLLAKPWKETQEVCDVVLTNPPFGAVEEPGVELATPEGLRSPDTLDLFVARIPSMLRPGGRAAVVVPDGFLFGGGARRTIREALAYHSHLRLVLRLPKGVFSPYTGIASNVLLFSRDEPEDSFWLYEVRHPGATRTFTKSRPLTDHHLSAFRDWWAAPEESESARQVKLSELVDHGFSLDLRPARPKVSPSRAHGLVHAADVAKSLATEAAQALAEALCEDASDGSVANLQVLIERGPLGASAITSDGRTLRQSVLLAGVTGWLNHLDNRVTPPAFGETSTGRTRGRTLPIDLRKLTLGANTDSWAWVPLRAYGELVGGGTPNTRIEGCFSESDGLPWLTPADLRGRIGKGVSRGRRYLTELGLKSSSAKVLPAGSVLFSTRAPIGYVAVAECPLATNQGFRSIVPSPGVSSDYLYYLLCALAPMIDDVASGTTFKEVSGGQLSGLIMPMPPEEHQVAIAQRLDIVSDALSAWESAVSEFHAREARALAGLLGTIDPRSGMS